MIISNDLHNLISTLTKSEKIYFKKNSKTFVNRDNNMYFNLYKKIESMTEYNEDEVLNFFKGKKFTNQISVAKNYLYNQIIKSLKSYRKNRTMRENVNNELNSLKILYEKRLFSQVNKKLKWCRKISERYELFSELMQILIWELKVKVTEHSYDKNTDKIIKNNYNQRYDILKKLHNMFLYDELEFEIVSFLNQYSGSKNEFYFKKLKSFIERDLMKNENLALSMTAKLKYLHIYSTYYFAVNNLEECYKNLSKELTIISANKKIIEERIQDYYILLTNLLYITLEINKLNDYKKNMHILKNEISSKELINNPSLKNYLSVRVYLLEINYFFKIEDFKNCINIYHENENINANLSISEKFIVWNLISQSYFNLKNFNLALEYLNKILNHPDAETRYNFYSAARIFNLIIHYELQNFDLIEYLIIRDYKYFYKKKKLFKFEKLFFRFIKNLMNVNNQSQLFEEFKNLEFNLQKIADSKPDSTILKYFDFLKWLRDKIRIFKNNKKQ